MFAYRFLDLPTISIVWISTDDFQLIYRQSSPVFFPSVLLWIVIKLSLTMHGYTVCETPHGSPLGTPFRHQRAVHP